MPHEPLVLLQLPHRFRARTSLPAMRQAGGVAYSEATRTEVCRLDAEGWTAADIARALGLTPGQVMGILRREWQRN